MTSARTVGIPFIEGRVEFSNLRTSKKYNLDKNSNLKIPSNKAEMFLVK